MNSKKLIIFDRLNKINKKLNHLNYIDDCLTLNPYGLEIDALRKEKKSLEKEIINFNNLINEAKQFLKSEISTRLKNQSYRDLGKIAGLNSKQLQRIIHEDKFPHFESVLKACQGLLDNTSKPTKPKKRRE